MVRDERLRGSNRSTWMPVGSRARIASRKTLSVRSLEGFEHAIQTYVNSGGARATPAISQGSLFFRTRHHVVAISAAGDGHPR